LLKYHSYIEKETVNKLMTELSTISMAKVDAAIQQCENTLATTEALRDILSNEKRDCSFREK